MRTVKIIVSVMLVTALAATMFLYCQYTLSEQRAGANSPVCHISKQGRKFIVEEFGWCEDLPTLIKAIEKYEIENFTYDKSYTMPLIQDFNFDSFLKEKTGVCWELAAFARCVIQQISETKNWNIANYIADVRLNHNFNRTHSYNYVIDFGNHTIYTFDMTPAVAHNKPWFYSFAGDSLDDIYDYAAKLNDDLYRVN